MMILKPLLLYKTIYFILLPAHQLSMIHEIIPRQLLTTNKFMICFLPLQDEIQQSLPQFLSAYEEYGGLVLNWMMFGSSGHISRPKGIIIVRKSR